MTNLLERILVPVASPADDFDATAVAFSSREASRRSRLLSGDVALNLITANDRPMVVLPDVEDGGGIGG